MGFKFLFWIRDVVWTQHPSVLGCIKNVSNHDFMLRLKKKGARYALYITDMCLCGRTHVLAAMLDDLRQVQGVVLPARQHHVDGYLKRLQGRILGQCV